MEKEKTSSSEDIFNKWLGYLRTDGQDIRYLHRDRPDILSDLISQFVAGGISHDDAKDYKSQIVIALTTEEGRKGKGKYKGWKNHVEQDYITILATFYVETVELSEEDDLRGRDLNTSTIGSKPDLTRYHPDNAVITEWAKDKYGQDWTPELNKEAHLIGGIYNLQFQREVFESDWILNPDTYPTWYKKACIAA